MVTYATNNHSINKKIISLTLLFSLIIVFISSITNATKAYSFTLECDGKSKKVETKEKDVKRILENENIKLETGDEINLDSFKIGGDSNYGNKIKVQKSVNVPIYEDNEKIASVKTTGTVEEALNKAKVKPKTEALAHGNVIINHSLGEELKTNTKIEIIHPFVVFIKVDGKDYSCVCTNESVKEVLNNLKIKYSKDDIISKNLDEKIQPNDVITVSRVNFKKRTVEEEVPYETIEEKDNSMNVGQKKTLSDGENGLAKVTYKDKFIDGKLDSNEKISEKILKKPISKKIAVGTKAVGVGTTYSPESLGAEGDLKNALTVIRGPATAYSAPPGALTASGRTARVGVVAVNPRQIPYGSKLYIKSTDGSPDYGYAVAGDTGGFVHNGSGTLVDLYFNTNRECCNWGRRPVDIYVLSYN